MKIINTKNAPAAVGPYSQAIQADKTLYISGQLPFDPKTMKCVEGTIKEQALMSLTNIKNITEAAGGNINNIVKVTVLITNIDEFSKVNEVYAEFFGEHKPARVCYEVSRLPKGVDIEIEAIAYLG